MLEENGPDLYPILRSLEENGLLSSLVGQSQVRRADITPLRRKDAKPCMFVQFILGTAYFVAFVAVLSFSLSFIAIPFLQEFLGQGAVMMNGVRYILPMWAYPLFVLTGFLLWTTFMNIARGIGQLHGRFAKWLLVSE